MSETPTDSSARRLDGKALSQRLLEELVDSAEGLLALADGEGGGSRA